MGRADYRRGRAPIRTAIELAELLPGTIYLLATGRAGPLFPNNGRAGPSVSVKVIRLIEPPPFLEYMGTALPVWVHWAQWENVVVPLLNDERTLQWVNQFSPQTVSGGAVVNAPGGGIGNPLPLPNDVVGPDKEVVYAKGVNAGMSFISRQHPSDLYGNGMQNTYLQMMAEMIQSVAESAGY